MTLRHTVIASGQTSHKSESRMWAKTKIRVMGVTHFIDLLDFIEIY